MNHWNKILNHTSRIFSKFNQKYRIQFSLLTLINVIFKIYVYWITFKTPIVKKRITPKHGFKNILQMSNEEPLVVEHIHMYEKENAEAHRTNNFEFIHLDSPTPVLRRGQIFNVALRFDREYVEDRDIVVLLFSFGPNPSALRGTIGINTVTSDDKELTDLEAWGVRMVGYNGTDLSVEVRSPMDSPVGVWQLNVETTIVDYFDPPVVYNYENDIYLLFNPWMEGN